MTDATQNTAPAPGFAELLRTGAACPKCGSAPAIRVGPALAAMVARVFRGGSVALSYQCQRRGCGAVYPITADELARFGTTKGRRVVTRLVEPGD